MADAAGFSRKADQVSRDLLARIVRGELAVGSVLPREADLATSYGVNRGVVREAVKLLEVHRLVRPVRKRGTEVLDPVRSMSPEVLFAMLVPRTGHVERPVLASFLEVRALLDAEMTVLATRRHDAKDLARLRKKLEEIRSCLGDPPAFARAASEMAFVVARATKNPVYEMLAAFNGRVLSELEAAMVTTRPPSPEHVEGFAVLVEVIASRDEEAARRVVTAFHAWATPRILASVAIASGAPLTEVLANLTPNEPPRTTPAKPRKPKKRERETS